MQTKAEVITWIERGESAANDRPGYDVVTTGCFFVVDDDDDAFDGVDGDCDAVD